MFRRTKWRIPKIDNGNYLQKSSEDKGKIRWLKIRLEKMKNNIVTKLIQKRFREYQAKKNQITLINTHSSVGSRIGKWKNYCKHKI